MVFRTCLLIAILAQISGCVVSPRVEAPIKLTFDIMQPDQKPMSYNDLLCCYDCQA